MIFGKKIKTPDYDPENPRCDEEQLKFLKECTAEGIKGIEKWNEWRIKEKVSEIWLQEVELREAHLERAHLCHPHLYLGHAHLEGANLRSTHLVETDLRGAYLEGADLSGAHLERADLREAHLKGVDFSGAYLSGANLWGVHLEGTNLNEAHLDGANLRRAHLTGADFLGTHLERADLLEAHLEGVYFYGTRLKGANLNEAHLEGVNFMNAYLQSTDFSRAIVDGRTLVWGCEVDRNTKFEGVGLYSMRIYPATKQLLEYNIRRMNWEAWYEYKDWDAISQIEKRGWLSRIIRKPVKLFWAISDYGLRTWRIIAWFFGLALLFAIAYRLWPDCVLVNDQVGDIRGFVHALYFSVVTMTTLGFGDIAANPDSWQGQVLLMVQVILGYVLLGALVTRFAVLFTAGGPAGKFEKKGK